MLNLALRQTGWPPARVEEPLAENGKYEVRLARGPAEVKAALKLRFRVFNVELRQGLASSWLTGRDEDEFDATSRHLIALDKSNGEIIGTYRLRAQETAERSGGFYTAREFELKGLPPQVLGQAIELGRACIAAGHRHTRALYLLWRGLVAYLQAERKRYFFGCCSLSSQDPFTGWQAWHWLRTNRHLHPYFTVLPREDWVCPPERAALSCGAFAPPKLFQAYLRFGVKACSPPVLDRKFGTIDFLVLFDLENASPQVRRALFP